MSDITRPTEAERLVEGVEELAYLAVIEHLRSFGPNASVAIIGKDEDGIENVLEGPNGLIRNYPDDFSRKTKMQFTHVGGGQVRCYTSSLRHANQYISGAIFSLIWAENLDISDAETEKLLKAAQYCLRIGPNPVTIFSKDGLITSKG